MAEAAAPADADPEPIRDADAYILDSKGFGMEGYTAAFILPGEPGAVLETAASPTADRIIEGVNRAGLDRDDVRYIFVTHIHLDHCGAAWKLLEAFPMAELVVHQRGASYLTDPDRVAKLMASVERAVGAERMDHYGTFEPVDETRVLRVEGGETFDVGDRTLEVHDAPGHAPHHYVVYDADHRMLYAGDALGIRLDRDGPVLQTTPPPGFDHDAWRMTVDRIEKLDARKVVLTHFGAFDAGEHIRRFRAGLTEWVDAIRDHHAEGTSEADAVSALMEAHADKRAIWGEAFEEEVRMNVRGVWLWLQRQAEGGGSG